MKTPDSSGWSQRTQRGIAASVRAGFEIEERDPRRVDRLAGREAVALGDRARRATQAAEERPELALDDQLREVLVGHPLAGRPARVGGGREGGQHVVVEEVGERSVPDVVEQAGHPHRLDDEALRRERLAGAPPASPEGSDRAIGPTGRPRA